MKQNNGGQRGLGYYLISMEGITKLGLYLLDNYAPTIRKKILERDNLNFGGAAPETSFLEAGRRGFARHHLHTDGTDVDILVGVHPIMTKLAAELREPKATGAKAPHKMDFLTIREKYRQDLVDAVRSLTSFLPLLTVE